MCVAFDQWGDSVSSGIAINLQGESVCLRMGSVCLHSIAADLWLCEKLVFIAINLRGIVFAFSA